MFIVTVVGRFVLKTVMLLVFMSETLLLFSWGSDLDSHTSAVYFF
jgi:hypothetical protein